MNKLQPLIVVPARAQGQIGAGKVVEFRPRNKRNWIPLPRNARTFDLFDEYEVNGDSLEGIGIFDGNLLTCRTNFDISEVKPNRVCIVYIRHLNEQTAKMVVVNNDQTVTLFGANPHYKPETFFADEIQILAIVEEVRQNAKYLNCSDFLPE